MVEEGRNFGDFFKKFWFLLWKDNSFKGWIFSIVFLFVIIKFVFFPLMSLVTGTALPLAIVESCSMYHEGNILSNFNDWFQKHEIKYENIRINQTEFSDFPLRKGFNKGDILLITRANPEKIEVGDIIIFQAELTNPIIHRIISIKEKTDGSRVFSTMGDNNNGQLPFEKEITEEQLVGKASFKLAPYAGWIKLVFFDWKKSQTERGFCVEN
ncbi:MAG: signal peptidase I [Nanoarchaeota archaeon]